MVRTVRTLGSRNGLIGHRGRRLSSGAGVLALGLTVALGLTAATVVPAAAAAVAPRLLRSVPVGGFPQGVAVSPDGSTAWVADFTDNELLMVSTRTNSVVQRIPVAAAPTGVAVSPDGSSVYVVGFSGTLSVVSTATRSVTRTMPATDDDDPGDYAVGVVVSPDGSTAYVSLYGGAVSTIDLTSATVTHLVWIGSYADGLALSPDGATLYAMSCRPATLSAIDTATSTVTGTVPAGSCDGRVALSRDGSTAWVAGGSAGVQVVRTHPLRLARTIGFGTSASFDVALSADASTAYVTSTGSNQLAVINAATGAVVRTAAAGPSAGSIALSPDGLTAYIADTGNDALAAVDTGLATTPWITKQPVNQTVVAGGSATYTVGVAGPLGPTLRWQLRLRGGYWNDIPGATGASYTTGPLTAAQSGRAYRVVATNREGSVSSRGATLTVAAAS